MGFIYKSQPSGLQGTGPPRPSGAQNISDLYNQIAILKGQNDTLKGTVGHHSIVAALSNIEAALDAIARFLSDGDRPAAWPGRRGDRHGAGKLTTSKGATPMQQYLNSLNKAYLRIADTLDTADRPLSNADILGLFQNSRLAFSAIRMLLSMIVLEIDARPMPDGDD